jgi:hypothetical protein
LNLEIRIEDRQTDFNPHIHRQNQESPIRFQYLFSILVCENLRNRQITPAFHQQLNPAESAATLRGSTNEQSH